MKDRPSPASDQRVVRDGPRKTVVSKWYPQLSQVHKCRTHRSFTCSDHSGAINISPHCAHGWKYRGWAGRGLVAVSRDIIKVSQKTPPLSSIETSRDLWRRNDLAIRNQFFESDRWPHLSECCAKMSQCTRTTIDTETKYTNAGTCVILPWCDQMQVSGHQHERRDAQHKARG